MACAASERQPRSIVHGRAGSVWRGVVGGHSAPRRLGGERGNVWATPKASRGPPNVERNDVLATVMPGDLDLPDGADRGVAGGPREALQLEDRLGEHRRRVEPEAHRRRSGVVAAAVHDDVRVNVAGDRPHDPDPVARVLQDTGLLDVHLDPAHQVVEDPGGVAPAGRLEAGLLGVLPEAAPVVERGNVSRSSLSVTLGTIRLPSSICPKPEPSSSRNETSCSGRSRPNSAFRRQTSSAATTPIVPSYLPPLRLESQCEPIPNTGSPGGRLRATSVPTGSVETSKPSSSSAPVK
jgi:hypothetical protein